VVFIGTSPFDVAGVVADADVPERPAIPEQPAAPRPEPAAPEPAVRLGFADGSTLALADDDPRAVALRTVAALLTTKD
jgi:hypothetical protein